MSKVAKVAALLPALLIVAAIGGAAREPDRAAIGPALRAVDAALHPIREGVIRVRSTVTRAGAEPAVSVVDVYVKGPDRVLCVFREGPLAARRILTVGDRTWLVVPGSERAIPVSANQRLLGGASIADVARLHFESEFDGEPRPDDEQVGGDGCRVLDLRARSRKSPYATAVLWIGREDGLPRKALLSLASGRTAKEVLFTAYRRLPPGPALERMRILHRLPSEHGMETDLELVDFESRSLGADLFTPAGARGLS
jgi:outer membrane lipoprotein-sorting protein